MSSSIWKLLRVLICLIKVRILKVMLSLLPVKYRCQSYATATLWFRWWKQLPCVSLRKEATLTTLLEFNSRKWPILRVLWPPIYLTETLKRGIRKCRFHSCWLSTVMRSCTPILTLKQFLRSHSVQNFTTCSTHAFSFHSWVNIHQGQTTYLKVWKSI